MVTNKGFNVVSSLALLLAVIAVTTQACPGYTTTPEQPNDLMEIAGEKYYIHDTWLEWTAAAKFCRDKKMQLVSFETREKWETIRDHLMAIEKYSYISFWTSGVLLVNSEWVWSGLAEPLTFSAWGESQPSPYGERYCLEMHSFYTLPDQSWYNYPCDHASKFMCEFACKQNK